MMFKINIKNKKEQKDYLYLQIIKNNMKYNKNLIFILDCSFWPPNLKKK